MSLSAVIDFMRYVKLNQSVCKEVKAAREEASQRCSGGFDDQYLLQLVQIASRAGYHISLLDLQTMPGLRTGE